MKKFISVLLSCVLVLSISVPVYAGGYIVRSTVETIEMTNGVVTGYSKQVYDSPVQYGTPSICAAPATTAPCTKSKSDWTPNWGANYAAEQAKWMASGKKSDSKAVVCQPQPYVYNYNASYSTIGDEARARATSVKSYAEEKGWAVSVSSDWGDCNYRNIDIKISNRDHSRAWTQKTVLVNGTYQTYYERDGHNEWLDDVKYYIKDRKV
ncbi:hypothetical protein IJG91_00925 [Candidatus Saccharibacteria bacterium]|nr:hypothetical protein [Candidatus Saccharibacteria bacterium]